MPPTKLRPLCAALVGIALTSPGFAETVADTVLATVGDTEITLGHVASTVSFLPEQYRALPDDVLLELVTDQLVRQTVLADAMEGQVTPRIAAGLDNERRAYLAAVMIERIGSAEITDDAIADAYATRYAEAVAQTEYNASHILVETREEALEIAGLLAEGDDFADLARERSIGPSGPQGGNLGWFTRGTMVPEFEEAVVTLAPGAVSEPVQTQFGWHVIVLNDTRVAKAPGLEEVREQLLAELRQEQMDASIEELMAAAGVRLSDALPDPALIRDLSIFEE